MFERTLNDRSQPGQLQANAAGPRGISIQDIELHGTTFHTHVSAPYEYVYESRV